VAPEPGAELRADGAPAGRITSSCVPGGLGHALALAFVGRKWLPAGTRLETTVSGRAVAATVL
jgi:glycine cleavage system aminomethyltransferase T